MGMIQTPSGTLFSAYLRIIALKPILVRKANVFF